jgi:phosphoglycolate phosphatase
MKNKYILFDFDGVIVDSFAPAFEVNKMICPHITEEEYKRRFEGNINDWKDVESKHNENCRHDIDFFAEYLPKMKKRVGIVPSMEKVIEELSKSYSLIVISSTLTAPIQELLEKYNLLHFFTEIMGNDVHTSKVEKIKMVFSKYNTDSKKCIFVTDTLGDIREATHMGVSAIGVSWGFNERETLMKGNPFKVANNPNELLSSISEYFSG